MLAPAPHITACSAAQRIAPRRERIPAQSPHPSSCARRPTRWHCADRSWSSSSWWRRAAATSAGCARLDLHTLGPLSTMAVVGGLSEPVRMPTCSSVSARVCPSYGVARYGAHAHHQAFFEHRGDAQPQAGFVGCSGFALAAAFLLGSTQCVQFVLILR